MSRLLLHAAVICFLAASICEAQSAQQKWVVKDPRYRPQAGDEAVLAYYATPGPGVTKGSWIGCPCFRSVSDFEKNSIATGKYEQTLGELKDAPDFFIPRPGTSVEILAKENADITLLTDDGDKKGSADVYRVRIKEGDFKGQVAITSFLSVCRLIETDTKPDRVIVAESLFGEEDSEPKPKKFTSPKKKTRRYSHPTAPTRVPNAKIVLSDIAWKKSSTGNYIEVDGRLKNVSDEDIEYVKATINYEDSSGKLVTSQTTYVSPNPLGSGEIGTFSTSVATDARIHHVKLSIMSSNKAIPWNDLTGQGVHQ